MVLNRALRRGRAMEGTSTATPRGTFECQCKVLKYMEAQVVQNTQTFQLQDVFHPERLAKHTELLETHDESAFLKHRPILSVQQLLNALREKDKKNCYTPTKEDCIQESLIVRSTDCKKDKENRSEDTTENYDVEKSTIRSRSRSPRTKATRISTVYGFIRRS